MDMPRPIKIPQGLKFQIPNGKPILWVFDFQMPKEEIDNFEFIAIDKAIYSEN
jgi:hypothetical protein